MDHLPKHNAQPGRQLLIAIGIFAGIAIIDVTVGLGLMLASTSYNSSPNPTSVPCQIETVNTRDVYNEPNNELTRVGAIEANTYRVVAFGGTDWAAVDWQKSGIEVSEDSVQFLDWIRLENGLDVLMGNCEVTPRLGVKPEN